MRLEILPTTRVTSDSSFDATFEAAEEEFLWDGVDKSVLKSTDIFAVALRSSSRNVWGLPSIRGRVRNCGHSIIVVMQSDKCREHTFCSYIFLEFSFPIPYFHSLINSFIHWLYVNWSTNFTTVSNFERD